MATQTTTVAGLPISLHEVHSAERCPKFTNWNELAKFLHESLKPYQDTVEDIRRGIEDAFRELNGRSGFVLIAEKQKGVVGALVMLRTGMSGYVPANLLLFVAVSQACRGQGIGRRLVDRAIALADGDVKLHVEYDNPARHLYEALGFETKYAEMRFRRSEEIR